MLKPNVTNTLSVAVLPVAAFVGWAVAVSPDLCGGVQCGWMMQAGRTSFRNLPRPIAFVWEAVQAVTDWAW